MPSSESDVCIGPLLFDLLQQMDREATTVRDGEPSGLNWYGRHARPDQKQPQTEPNWTKALAVRLRERGISAAAEVPYPTLENSQRNRCCDLVITCATGRKLWIEIKGAWKTYWHKDGRVWIYESYLFHPLLPGLDESKTHTVPLDLERLASLQRAHADQVGMLLVGFDSDTLPMDEDVEKLMRLAHLDIPPWAVWTTQWPDPYRPGERVRCWYWQREVPE